MWTPEEFVLYGHLCDDKSLSDQVELVREAAQADAVILLVSRGDEFFRSMIRASHRNREFAPRLQAELILGCAKHSEEPTRGFPDWNRYVQLDGSREFFPQSIIYTCLMSHFVGATSLALFPSPVEINYVLHPWDEAPPSFLLAILSPSVAEEKVRSSVLQASKPLQCMINASQTVRARRWNYAMRKVDQRLDDCERKWLTEVDRTAAERSEPTRNEFDHLIRFSADLLLKEATHLTRSSIGQVFITQSDELRLALYAYEKYRCGERTQPHEDPTIQLDNPDAKGLVLMAFHRVRAVLINDIRAFERTHPLVKYLKPTGAEAESQAELIIPITQNTAGDEHVVFGVLNLEKEYGRYTMRDLDVCQHLARRYCRWWARIQHTIFAKSLAQLTRRVALPPSSRKGTPTRVENFTANQARSGHMRRIGDEWYDDRVPSEFRHALSPVKEALKTAFELTRSHMARVFLITADGDALVPFCDYPFVEDIHQSEPAEPARFETRSHGEGPAFDVGCDAGGRVIRLLVIKRDLHTRSISAWVAEHGLPCFIGNFGDPDALAEYDGLESYVRTYDQTCSECCVPLFITGRLIGTLNFQSVHINIYREQRHLIEAIAELIGLTFAHERRAVEQEILENHAVLASRKHDLMHVMRDLTNLAGSQAGSLSAEFLKKLNLANNMIFNIDCRNEEQMNGDLVGSRAADRSVAELVRAQIPRVRVPVVSRPSLDLACPDDFVPEDSIASFTHALHEVLQNAQSGVEDSTAEIENRRWKLEDAGVKGDSLAFGNLVIDCERRRLGGRAYAMIRVRNRCMNVGVKMYQQVLYRQPFQANQMDRPHLGAFIAGSLLRSVGGEMSFAMESVPPEWGRGFIATTQLQVKLEPREAHG